MAGINVPQYNIFKIGTKKLKYSDWDLTITEDEAYSHNEIVALFEGQEFRIIAKILDQEISKINFKEYIISVLVEHPSHFQRLVSDEGIKVNGITYRRFLGTTGGLKCNTLLLVNIEILDELNRRCECGRDTTIPIVPAKLEAYKALTCSASQPISMPKEILVVTDSMVHIKNQHVVFLDDTDDDKDIPEMKELFDYECDNNATDGFNLCSIGYMERVSKDLGLSYVTHGVCLRNAWLKGMLFPFPIVEFAEECNNGEYVVKDIWGNEHDLRSVEMILTESSLKLWSSYSSIEDYIEKCNENGYEFAVTKIISHKMEDYREVNYQYLQSYDFTDEDIEELCALTVKYLKNSLCGDYEALIEYLGIVGKLRGEDVYNWQHALKISKYMMHDPYIIDSVFKMIKKKIDRAKIGKLIVEGNYQVLSGDPFIFMQHVCGLEETGLLGSQEYYSKYWIDKGVDEIVLFRSPMLVHNNICKGTVKKTDDVLKWYRYMDTALIINAWDTTCQALSGADYDSDVAFSSNNRVLLSKYEDLPAIVCQQKAASKIIPRDIDMIAVEKNGMGNKVGSITNRITAMIERMSNFNENSREYKELEYRTLCGQLYQQNEIDRLKGIISKQMPSSWYNYRGCKGDEFLKSICAEKKPYFMIYIYDDYKNKYKRYLEETNKTAYFDVGCSIQALQEKSELTEEEQETLDNFERWCPFGMNKCTMNRICFYIEDVFSKYTSKLKKEKQFDYTKLKYPVSYDIELLEGIETIANEFNKEHKSVKFHRLATTVSNDKELEQNFMNKNRIAKKYRELITEKCENDMIQLNVLLDLFYTGRCGGQFFWSCGGKLMIERLEQLKEVLDNA